MTTRLSAMVGVLAIAGASLLWNDKAEGQASPRETVVKLNRALRNQDKQGFLECIVRTGENKEAVEALYEYLRASFRLREVIEKRYGQAAWSEFERDSDESDEKTSIQLRLPPKNEDWIAETTITIDGNTATWLNPYSEREELLVLEGDVWRVDLFNGVMDFEAATKSLRHLTAGIDLGIEMADGQVPPSEIRTRISEYWFFSK